jgi:hypothetical protein
MSAHTVLIAAIFIPYMVLMTTLGAYIWRTGQPCRQDRGGSEEDRDPGPAAAPAAA